MDLEKTLPKNNHLITLKTLIVLWLLFISYFSVAQPNVVTDIDSNPSNATTSSVSQANDMYQSFTPTQDGRMVRIDLIVRANSVGTRQLDIYEGEGISGTLLHTQSVTSQAGLNEYDLSVPVPIIGGQLYTFALTDTDPAILVGTDYSGGRLIVTFNGNPFEFDADFKILLDIGTNTNLSNRGDFTNNNPITFDLETFGTVVGLDLSVFQVTNGTASSLVENTPGVYDLEVTPSGEGLVSVDMFEGALIIDGLDSDATMASTTYDITPPDNQDLIFVNNQLFTTGGQVLFNDPAVTPLVFFAPEGTTEFIPSSMITQGVIVPMQDDPTCVPMPAVMCEMDAMTGMPIPPGCAEMPEVICTISDVPILNAPATAGAYKLFVLDEAGNVSQGSVSTLFVTNETHATTSVITVSDSQLFSGETAEVSFLFLDAVTDFTNDDLSVESGTLSPVISTDGNISFNATFTPNEGVDNTGFAIVIINSQITDGSTAGSGFTLSNEYAVHTLAPAITSIRRQTPTEEITGADEVTFRVTFNVAVENSSVEASDFTLSGTASADGTLSAPVMIDSRTYDFTVTGLGISNGTIGLDYTGTIHYLAVSNTVTGGDPIDEETFTLRNTILSFDSSPILSVDQSVIYSYPIEVSSNLGGAGLNVTGNSLPSWLELNNTSIINTIVGGGDSFDEDIPATDAVFNQTINDMEYDSEGNLYFIVGSQIKKVDLDGNISTFAGTTQGFSGDGGPASMAQFNQMIGFGIDGNDNFYIADRQNFRIRKIDNAGIITTIAGTGVRGDSGDGGLAVNAEITSVSLLAADNAGNVYFANDRRIRRIGTDGIISTYAGGGSSNPGGQQATDARLFFSQSLASDGDGNIYIGQARNIFRVDAATNVITNYAGNGITGFSGDDGAATSASLDAPVGLALDSRGTLFMADGGNNRIRKVTIDGIISTIAGNGENTFSGVGVDAVTAGLAQLSGIAVDKTGQVVFSDQGSSFRVIRSIQTNRATLTGTPSQAEVGSNAISLTVSNGIESADQNFTISVANVNDLPELVGAERAFEATQDVAFDQLVSVRDIDGDLFDIEITNSPDWLAAEVEANLFTFTSGGTFSDIAYANDQFYLTDFSNHAIFTVDPLGGNLTQIAGASDGTSGLADVDGDLSMARFNVPFAIDVAENGDIYVIDQQNHALRVISIANNTVSTIVGNGMPGFCNGACSDAATLNEPNNLLIAPNGDIYISDAGNGVIRLLSGTTGDISTLQDEGGNNLTFNSPYGLALDGNGVLYVTDNGAHTVWAIDGNSATLIAGAQGILGNVDGSALDARFDEPAGIVVNADGSLIYVAEATGNIRQIAIGTAGNTVSTLLDNADTPIGLLVNPLNNSLLYAESGLSSINEVQFSIRLNGTPANSDVGANEVSLTLSDGIGEVVTETIQVSVANVNDAPEFTSTPPVTAIERMPYTYTLEGVDIDDDELFFSAVSIPDWLTLSDISTPILEGTPTASDLGEHMIVLMVSDGNLFGEQSFTIEVLNVPDVIEVTSGLSQTFGIGDEIQFQAGFDGNININLGSENPTITLETGEVDRVATYVSGGNNDANLVFSYTVQEGDVSGDLDYNSSSIELGTGTTLLSNEGITVDVTLPAVGDFGSLSATSAIVVDGIVPEISTLSLVSNNSNTASATLGDEITISFTTTEELNAIPTVTLGGVNLQVTETTNANEYSGTLTVATGTFEEGVIGLQIMMTDLAGNTATRSPENTIVIDTIIPETTLVSISSSNANSSFATVGDVITVSFTSSERLSETLPQVSVLGESASVSLSNMETFTYQAIYTVRQEDVEGTVSFNITELLDVAGNVSLPVSLTTDESEVLLDRTLPSVTVSSMSESHTNTSFSIAINFSEAVTGFASEDVQITNGTLSDLAGSGAEYTAVVTPSIGEEVTVSIPENVVIDAASNGNSASNSLAVEFDATTLTVLVSSPVNLSTNEAFDVTVTFSQEVTGFELSELTVSNGVASNFSGSGTTYTATVTPTAEGEVAISVADGVASNSNNNENVASNLLSVIFDVTPPIVTLSTDVISPTNSAFEIMIAFSEEVSVFDLMDLVITNGTASNLQVDNGVYLATITPAEDGNVSVSIASGSINDLAGNSNALDSNLSILFDGTVPTANISSETISPTNGAFDIAITFSEEITGLELSDLQVINGTVDNLSGEGDTYSATVSPASDGEITITLPASSVSDLANNGNAISNTLTVVVNSALVTVEITASAASPINEAFGITVEFGADVQGLDLTDFMATNATVSDLSGSGSSYAATVTPSADGIVSVELPFGSVTGLDGNENAAAVFSTIFDGTAPVLTLVNITSNNSEDASTALVGDVITISLTSSEELANDPQVTILGRTAEVVKVEDLNFSAKITVLDTDPVGVVSFDIASVTDLAGNDAPAINETTDGSVVSVATVTSTVAGDLVNIEISVYPNPTSDNFQIELNDASQVDRAILYTISGNEVLNYAMDTRSINVNVEGLSKGLYLLVLLKEGNILNKSKVRVN